MKTILLLFCIISFGLSAQKNLTINGEPLSLDCIKVLNVDELDTLTPKVKIYNASITGNCLELGVFYGECPVAIELVTDNKLIETQDLTLNFLLRYEKGSAAPCKANSKITLHFDILPFKNIRAGKYIIISFLGEKYHLVYK